MLGPTHNIQNFCTATGHLTSKFFLTGCPSEPTLRKLRAIKNSAKSSIAVAVNTQQCSLCTGSLICLLGRSPSAWSNVVVYPITKCHYYPLLYITHHVAVKNQILLIRSPLHSQFHQGFSVYPTFDPDVAASSMNACWSSKGLAPSAKFSSSSSRTSRNNSTVKCENSVI